MSQSPFACLNALLSDVSPGDTAINLTIGEPGHPVPDFVAPVLAANIADFGRYPAIRGTDAFRAAVATWAEKRFQLKPGTIDRAKGVLPLNGSRDGLFTAAFPAVARRKPAVDRPVILMPNPFYQVYAAAAKAAGAEVVMLPAGAESGFLPDLAAVPPELAARSVALYYATPANPQGAVASVAQLEAAIRFARQHDLMLFCDECYSEIYRDAAPAGALTVAQQLSGDFKHVVAFNSLS